MDVTERTFIEVNETWSYRVITEVLQDGQWVNVDMRVGAVLQSGELLRMSLVRN